jgi:hypothetical protein
MAVVVEEKIRAPVWPFPSRVFVMLMLRMRAVAPTFRKIAPSPLPLVSSKLHEAIRRQPQNSGRVYYWTCMQSACYKRL